MKVAIMTQPLGKNYGGIIQAWALQNVLKSNGYEPVTINRQSNKTGILYERIRFCARFIKKILGKRVGPVNLDRKHAVIFSNTERFIFENLRMSEAKRSTKQIKKHFLNNRYDAVIVGSDQTWRPSYSPDIFNFFLDFLEGENIVKLAYATSFGVDYWEYSDKQTIRCSELAKKFNAISVREESGINLCKKYLDVDSKLVLDPTLLLDKDDYNKLLVGHLKNQSEGLYTYFLDKDNEVSDFINRISEELGETLLDCQAKCNIRNPISNRIQDYVMPDLKDWLAGFANANFVITDSFHGMVFSIIFEKPFLVVINEGRGAARFTSMAKWLGVKDRIISRKDLLDPKNIDYLTKPLLVDRTQQIAQSLYFLKENLPKL